MTMWTFSTRHVLGSVKSPDSEQLKCFHITQATIETNFNLTVVVAVLYFLLSFTGLTIYISYVSIIIRYRQTRLKSVFYTLSIALAAADIPNLAVEMFCVVPFLFVRESEVKCAFNMIAGCVVNVTYYLLSAVVLLISLNRLFAVCFSAQYHKVFSSRNVKMMLVFAVVSSIVRTTLLYLSGCIILFVSYSFNYICESKNESFQEYDT